MRNFVCVVFGLTALFAADAKANEVGVVAAVNRIVTGERPQETSRVLSIKDNLIENERVTTSPNGGGQVMFLDQTTLTLTPNSDIVLDRYVYDPAQGTGGLAVTMLGGAMRLVGGRITKKEEAVIRTPSATIGIRGGIGHVTVRDDGSTRYMHIAGFSATITTTQGTITVTREGGVVEISAPGDGGALNPGAVRNENGEQGGQPRTGPADARDADDRLTRTGGLPTTGSGGGVATYVGVATPDILAASLGISPGFGDGGSPISGLPELISNRIEEIEPEISGRAGAARRAPISTIGEQQSVEFAEQPETIGEVPREEIADINQAESLADEITQGFDALTFNGTWAAVVGLTDGTFSEPQDGLDFQFEYSLVDEQGIVTIELPDAAGLAAPNLTAPDGTDLAGDQIIVIGDGLDDIGGDGTVSTLLNGDAGDTTLAISLDDVATGSIFVDYEGSDLDNIGFVDGLIDPVGGEPALPDPINDATDALRESFR